MKVHILACTRCYRTTRKVVPAAHTYALPGVLEHSLDVCATCADAVRKCLQPFAKQPRARRARNGTTMQRLLEQLAAHATQTTAQLGRNYTALYQLRQKKYVRRVKPQTYAITAAGRARLATLRRSKETSRYAT